MVDQSMLTGESVPVDAGAGSRGLCRLAGAPRPGHRRRDGDRGEDLFRPHGRAGAPRPRSQHGTSRDFRRDAQPRHRQRRGGCLYHRLCLCRGTARRRPNSPGADRSAGHHPAGAAGDVYAIGRIERADTCPPRRAVDPAVGRARGRRDGRAVRRQDRHADAQCAWRSPTSWRCPGSIANACWRWRRWRVPRPTRTRSTPPFAPPRRAARRCARAAGALRPLRSGDQDLGGLRPRSQWQRNPHRQRRIRGDRQAGGRACRQPAAGRRSCRARLPRPRGRRGASERVAPHRPHRAQRSPARGIFGADRRSSLHGRAHRHGDRGLRALRRRPSPARSALQAPSARRNACPRT